MFLIDLWNCKTINWQKNWCKRPMGYSCLWKRRWWRVLVEEVQFSSFQSKYSPWPSLVYKVGLASQQSKET